MPKAIHDIIDSNSEKNNEILIVLGMNISDTISHQTDIQIFSSPNVCSCTTWGTEQTQLELK